jgi:glycosyltransferase involved in cell wall biosynthesis
MISPHLPPEQAANALLPVLLGGELSDRGITISYVAHPPAGARQPAPIDRVVYVPRRGRGAVSRTIVGAAIAAIRMAWGVRRAIQASDLVHLHGNGLIIEVGQFVAARYRKPYVLTLYGTDVWHHDPARNVRFGDVVRDAACRAFYSNGLLDFAKNLGLAPDPSIVIYAPVPSTFETVDPNRRRALRRDLGVSDGPLLLTVKRLHPVGGHEDLLRGMPAILRDCPDAQLWLAGEGELRPALEALTRELGIESHVRFLGLVDNAALWRYYAAADLFVLPSRLESWGTVMLEALACGTPVVATATAGAREVHALFPDDVAICEPGNVGAFAAAIVARLREPRRTDPATLRMLRDRFSPSRCASEYLRVYEEALG